MAEFVLGGRKIEIGGTFKMLASLKLGRNSGREYGGKEVWGDDRLREFAKEQETIYVGGLRHLDRSQSGCALQKRKCEIRSNW
jgi:hypothetical protein